VVIALIVITVALVWLARTAPEAEAEQIVERRAAPRGWRARSLAWLREFGGSMRELATGPRMIPLLVLTILAWLGQLATFVYAARAARIHLPVQGSLAALLAVNVSLVVRATPGNVGFFQFAYALATAPFGVIEANAVGVAVLIQALQIIPTTLIGVALAPEFIFRRKAKTPAAVGSAAGVFDVAGALVEARGFEPRSEARFTTASTCVAFAFLSLQSRPGRRGYDWTRFLLFRDQGETAPGHYPEFAIPGRRVRSAPIQAGAATALQQVTQPGPSCRWQL
jgi:hypothetical protein